MSAELKPCPNDEALAILAELRASDGWDGCYDSSRAFEAKAKARALLDGRAATRTPEPLLAEAREVLKPFERIAAVILSEAPAYAELRTLHVDCEGVSHSVTMDELRAISALLTRLDAARE